MSLENNRPKMLRQDSKSLGITPCVAAYNTVEAILRKDAIHPTPVESQPTYRDTLINLSDTLLDNKYKLIDLLDKALKDLMINTLIENDEHNQNFSTQKATP